MNTGITKLGAVLTKLQSTQAQYGKAVQKTLAAQLKIQQKMATALGVMAQGAQLNNKLMKQLMNAQKKKPATPPSNALLNYSPTNGKLEKTTK